MKDEFTNHDNVIDREPNSDFSPSNENSNDDRCAIISGQIGHLLEKGYCLGDGCRAF